MRSQRGAVFLDRDGVINASPTTRFVTDWKQFRFLPGVLEALQRLKAHGKKVIVVSNQSAVGRGILTRNQLNDITQRMLQRVESAGGKIRAVFYCLHRPDAGCSCRKPKTGLLKKAAQRFGINLKRSFVVGDAEADIAMGLKAGCRAILVLSGKQTHASTRFMSVRPHRVVKDLDRAVRYILGHP